MLVRLSKSVWNDLSWGLIQQVWELSETDNKPTIMPTFFGVQRWESKRGLNFSLKLSFYLSFQHIYFCHFLFLQPGMIPWIMNLLRRETVRKCAFISLDTKRQTCWREIKEAIRCSQAETMTASFSHCFQVWPFGTDPCPRLLPTSQDVPPSYFPKSRHVDPPVKQGFYLIHSPGWAHSNYLDDFPIVYGVAGLWLRSLVMCLMMRLCVALLHKITFQHTHDNEQQQYVVKDIQAI